ncbi:hypothetical protein PhCBS80983_g06233 [Powellomyces hirtus]|uniref:Alpha/beta hydrolase fold-3 domain-containing protein n=1 Tax=Powellomyces hirtus TaxID=109895 RepID=A0A507DRV4_9FUNG|nr:hypothetical protein PhCBS80983_g06233 [Powellomyces hirtus]
MGASTQPAPLNAQQLHDVAGLDQVRRPTRGPLPTWTRTFQMTLGVLRGTLERNKDNVWRARLLTDKAATPIPLRVKLSKIYIPRRKDVLPEGMSERDAEGVVKGEWVDWDRVPNEKVASERVILYVHGGAYFICSRKTHRGITYRLAKYAKARLLAIDYRLAPEATFPVPLNDIISCYLFLIDPPPHTGAPKYRPEQVTFMGDSAGGALALSSLLWLRDHGKQYPMPGCAALISPWMDLTHSMPSWRLNNQYDYLPDGSNDPKYINKERSHYYVPHNSFLDHPLVSPLFAKEDPQRPLPPLLIQIGDAEKLRDECIAFTEHKFPNSPIRLELYEDQVHVFHMFATFNSISTCALKRMGQFTLDMVAHYTNNANDHDAPPPPVDHAVLRIANSKNHPATPIIDPLRIIDDAKNVLMARNQWIGRKSTGKPAMSRSESVFVVDPDYVNYDLEVAKELDNLAIAGGQVKP